MASSYQKSICIYQECRNKEVCFLLKRPGTEYAAQKIPLYIKIMLCVEDDRSDCQTEANSIARSRRLRAVVVVEG